MFKNYLTTALRNLYRNKLFSTINIIGLAIGMMATILILLFVNHETSYDKWLPGHERIYRLHTTFSIPGRDVFKTTSSSGPMRRAFEDTFDEVESATRLFYSTPRVFKDGEVFDQQVTLVDPEFFDVFDIPLIAGNRDQALSTTNSLVISETTARRFFGGANPVGKTLTLCCYGPENNSLDYNITGVMADTPENAHFDFQAIGLIDEARFSTMSNLFESWTSVNNYTYFKLKPGASPEAITDRFDWFLENVMPGSDQAKEQLGLTNSELIDLYLMPISDIHLKAVDQVGDGGDIRPLGDQTLVIAFLFIAVLILGIATVNFVNLATARFIQRAKEVSMRKVLGAGRRNVARQFLGEALLSSFLALLVAVLMVEIVLPWYNSFLDKDLTLKLFGQGGIFLELVLIAIVSGLLGGAYPAFYVSRLQPAKVLKGEQAGEDKGSSRLKAGLIVFQFAISIALITTTAVTYVQTDFAKTVDLGYETDNRLIVRNLGRSGASEMQETLVGRFKQLPGVLDVVQSSDVPTENNENNTAFAVLGKEQKSGNQILNYITIDYDFLEAYGVDPLYGRTFSEDYGSDTMYRPDPDSGASGAAIINVSAAKRLGFDNPKDALGEVLTTQLFRNGGLMTVVGVVPDFSFRSAHHEGLPTLYLRFPGLFRNITIVHDGRDPQALAARVGDIWKTLVPTVPFTYAVLDDLVANQYSDEDRQVLTFSGFAVLAIFISCLGLFSLAAITTERRTKEIGIRKVFGASIRQVVQLLAWQFSKPVVIANLIAWPVAWYFLNDWLAGFVYRIDLSPTYFFGAGLAALFIAWATVAAHAWRVAKANPINALRYQ